MNHRLSLPIIAALFIVGCASSSKFVGSSVTDQVLRQDIYKNVSLFFQAQYGCSDIDTVNTKITNITQAESGVIAKARELWTVHGCNKEAAYDIKLSSDTNGETDFTVSNINKISN